MYGIICTARKGRALGVKLLALVDRQRSKRLWWTSDNANIAICYEKKSAADFAANRLKKNGARVVPFAMVQQILAQQSKYISSIEDQRDHDGIMVECEQGWDAHKF